MTDSETISIHIYYYALLRDQRGCPEETINTSARTAEDLYAALREKHKFSFSHSSLKVAINNTFCDWGKPLTAGDKVVFIPPVAGG